MFAKKVKDVKKLVNLYIAELSKNIKVEKVILFGSYGRKTERDYSDIDILIVSDNFDGGSKRDYRILDSAARRINPLIEAIPCTKKDFNNYEKGDFIHAIRKTGKMIFDKAA